MPKLVGRTIRVKSLLTMRVPVVTFSQIINPEILRESE